MTDASPNSIGTGKDKSFIPFPSLLKIIEHNLIQRDLKLVDKHYPIDTINLNRGCFIVILGILRREEK